MRGPHGQWQLRLPPHDLRWNWRSDWNGFPPRVRCQSIRQRPPDSGTQNSFFGGVPRAWVRAVLAGMKQERANPREVEGKQTLFVVNLQPRKMAGIVAEAMLFDIGYADGILPVLAVPEAHVPDGTRAG